MRACSVRAASAAALCAALGGLAALGVAASPAAGLTPLRAAQFCQTPAPFDETGCQWQRVSLPHRWEVAGDVPAWALYRLSWSERPPGAIAVVADHLSLHGSVRLGTQTVTPAAALRSQDAYLRYWPQVYAFAPQPQGPGVADHVDIAVRGHPRAKSGLGAVHAGPLQQALAWQAREWLLEVALVLALAGACGVAGAVGLFAGHRYTLVERLLRTISLLAILAGTRTAMNFVVEPLLPWAAWNGLGLWLLAAIGTLACVAPLMYLRPHDKGIAPIASAGLAALAVVLAALPAQWHLALAESLFAALLLVAAVSLSVLGWRVARQRDPLGFTLFLPVTLILLSGAHDLAVHLGSASLSDRYLQKWSAPALLVLMVVLLARRAAAQQAVAEALQNEIARRQDLLRELHDGIGSRLVALSYHVRQRAEQGDLVDEIDGLIRELQLLQGAVRAKETTLDMLVADLRHLYARVGGGSLPVCWQVTELPCPTALSAEQAVATARILEEGVANVMKHAPGSAIRVSLCPGPAADTAVLEIFDAGPGRFHEGAGAGLLHMRQRAAAAGIGLEFIQPADNTVGKAVRLTFGAPPAPLLGRRASAMSRLLRVVQPITRFFTGWRP